MKQVWRIASFKKKKQKKTGTTKKTKNKKKEKKRKKKTNKEKIDPLHHVAFYSKLSYEHFSASITKSKEQLIRIQQNISTRQDLPLKTACVFKFNIIAIYLQKRIAKSKHIFCFHSIIDQIYMQLGYIVI